MFAWIKIDLGMLFLAKLFPLLVAVELGICRRDPETGSAVRAAELEIRARFMQEDGSQPEILYNTDTPLRFWARPIIAVRFSCHVYWFSVPFYSFCPLKGHSPYNCALIVCYQYLAK
jgi:hypothetical protein